MRALKNTCKYVLRKIFEIVQRVGFNILPCHFYSEIPNIRELKSNDHWKKPYSLIGVSGADILDQFKFVEEICENNITDRKKSIYKQACEKSKEIGYGPIESDFLHCFIHNKRPKKIIQVGCGVSTAVMLDAAERSGYSPEIVCIEPHPSDFLLSSAESKKIVLIQEKAQMVAIEVLTDLKGDGFLFIDSTHTVKAGSEVNKLVLEVLPRLNKDNYVHFHDIYFPYDYPRKILTTELFFSNETALLHSFLANNFKYELKAALSMLHYADPQRLKKVLLNYIPSVNQEGIEASEGHFPSSLYLEVVK